MSDALLFDLVTAIAQPALLVDGEEWIIASNDAAQAMFGPNLRGRQFAAILRQPPVIEAVEACLEKQAPTRARHLSHDGAQETYFEVTCRPVAALPGALISFADLTQLRQAGQMRRDFVANVSHELRTPLTALMGFVETLRGSARDDPEARERFLGIMADEAGRMNRLVGDLLSLSRVESEERVRPTDKVDPAALIGSVLETIRPLASDAGVTISTDIPDLPSVSGDPDQLRQVLANLIENAIKYGGEKGQVKISASISDKDAKLRGPALRIAVADSGPGIDPIHLPRLTERFYRVDSHRSRSLGGTGLGLAIVKHILNRHRGRLTIDSTPGQGSVFTVILPR